MARMWFDLGYKSYQIRSHGAALVERKVNLEEMLDICKVFNLRYETCQNSIGMVL